MLTWKDTNLPNYKNKKLSPDLKINFFYQLYYNCLPQAKKWVDFYQTVWQMIPQQGADNRGYSGKMSSISYKHTIVQILLIRWGKKKASRTYLHSQQKFHTLSKTLQGNPQLQGNGLHGAYLLCARSFGAALHNTCSKATINQHCLNPPAPDSGMTREQEPPSAAERKQPQRQYIWEDIWEEGPGSRLGLDSPPHHLLLTLVT